MSATFPIDDSLAQLPYIQPGRDAGPIRVMLVANDPIAPGPTGSGNRAIRYGLIDGLRRAGADPAFYSAAPVGKHLSEFTAARRDLSLGDDRFWFDRPAQGPAAVAALRDALASLKPNLVIAYGTQAVGLISETGWSGKLGLTSVDLEFLPILYRHVYNLRFGRSKQKVKSAILTPKILADAWSIRREVKRDYRRADFILNHAAHHALWHASSHDRPVLYTPNPVAEIFNGLPPRQPSQRPRFLLVGGIGGIATLTGLAWFARYVYPIIDPWIAAGEIEVHLIGRGELEPSLDNRMTRLVRRGYVEDLTAEFATATALLVPTPITLGFRTRIVDAFRHRLAVVAHAANAVGMPELRDGHNAIVSATPADFAQGIRRMAADPKAAQVLGDQAFADFTESLNAVAVARKLLKFAHSTSRARLLTVQEGAR